MNEGWMLRSEFAFEGAVRSIMKGVLKKAAYSPKVNKELRSVGR